MTTYVSYIPDSSVQSYTTFTRTMGSLAPSFQSITAIVRTSWSGGLYPMSGQLWPRVRRG